MLIDPTFLPVVCAHIYIYIYIYIYTNLISTSIHGTREKKKKKPARNKR